MNPPEASVAKKRIIYANSNHEDCRYIKEAIISAKSFKKYVDNCEIVLYTNEPNFRHQVFDKVYYADFVVPEKLKNKIHKNGQMLVKQQAMIETTARINLVLGSDTLALSDKVNSAFELLDKFDIAVAHAPVRIAKPIAGIPEAYPEFNCDVIFYKKGNKTIELFKTWQEMYRNNEIDHPHDQGTFRYLTYKSDLKIAILPFEYNNRISYGQQASSIEKIESNTVILQNREIISQILEGKQSISSILEKQDKRRQIKSFLKKIVSKIT